MPIYEYRCTSCAHLFEVFAKMSDPPPAGCEQCGAATIEKVLHPAAVHYKGSGFYATDYGSKRSGRGGSGESGEGASSSAGESSTSGDSSSTSGSSESSSSSTGTSSGASTSSGSGSD